MRPPKPTQAELRDLVAGIVAGYLRDLDLQPAAGKSGRIKVEVEVCLSDGEVPWSTGSVSFTERRNYYDG
jgi:hypothetical protein